MTKVFGESENKRTSIGILIFADTIWDSEKKACKD